MSLPDRIQDALESLRYLPMGKGIRTMLLRQDKFASQDAAMLAGAAMLPESREMIERKLDEEFERDPTYLPTYADEVIIGGGLHAAVYAAGRVARGFPRPIVLETGNRVGGAFAVSKAPSFYLNSLNRPGLVGGNLGNRGSLNYLPGSILQPADLSMEQFQTNSDLGFLIRIMLASFARVYTNASADYVSLGNVPEVQLIGGYSIGTARLIDARGLGTRQFLIEPDGTTVLSFEQLMTRADQAFPLADMNRVAIIGDGDSAKVAAEMLLGIGPKSGYSSASLDYINQIDWYGPGIPIRRKDFRRNVRERYDALGYYLTETYRDQERERLTVYQTRGNVTKSLDSVIVNGVAYDKAILCTGSRLSDLGMSEGLFERYRPDDSTSIASKASGYPVYRVGPAANLEWDSNEYSRRYARNRNNKVSIFRMAPRTAALAASLPY